jgi:hypothetical protein
MRKIGMVIALGALLLAMAAGTALALNDIQCKSKPCYGTNQADFIRERVGNGVNDEIRARAGGDVVDANNYSNDRDLVYGSDGSDTLRVNDGDTKDEARGDGGVDKCIVDARSEAVSGCDEIVVD